MMWGWGTNRKKPWWKFSEVKPEKTKSVREIVKIISHTQFPDKLFIQQNNQNCPIIFQKRGVFQSLFQYLKVLSSRNCRSFSLIRQKITEVTSWLNINKTPEGKMTIAWFPEERPCQTSWLSFSWLGYKWCKHK